MEVFEKILISIIYFFIGVIVTALIMGAFITIFYFVGPILLFLGVIMVIASFTSLGMLICERVFDIDLKD